MLFNRYKDISAAIAVLIIALIFFIAAGYLDESPISTMGPEFMPRVVSGLVFFLGAINFYNAFKKLKSTPKPTKEETVKPKVTFKEWFYAHLDWVSAALMLAYVLSMDFLGFVISSSIFCFLQMHIMTCKQKRNYIIICLVSFVLPALIYYVFVNFFYLLLPAGLLG